MIHKSGIEIFEYLLEFEKSSNSSLFVFFYERRSFDTISTSTFLFLDNLHCEKKALVSRVKKKAKTKAIVVLTTNLIYLKCARYSVGLFMPVMLVRLESHFKIYISLDS
jgi:hypothetical protein